LWVVLGLYKMWLHVCKATKVGAAAAKTVCMYIRGNTDLLTRMLGWEAEFVEASARRTGSTRSRNV
jgi:hypothetical protein